MGRKGIVNRVWERLLLAVVGNQYEQPTDVCGIVVSVRYQEDIVSLWNRSAKDTEQTARLK